MYKQLISRTNFLNTEFMKIKLSEWAARNYSPAPTFGTLKSWAKSGQINPTPERVGRLLMVDEDAVRVPISEFIDIANMSARARNILKIT